MTKIAVLSMTGLALCAMGCISKSEVVRTRAAFDMSCEEAGLQITPLTSEMMSTATYGVRGCGKQATYIYTPGAGAVLNTDIDPAEPTKAK
jgi:hypothetical protein